MERIWQIAYMTTSHPHPSTLTRMACIVVGILCVGALAYPPLPLLTLLGDSEQYREASDLLLSGGLPGSSGSSSNATHIASVLRPPLFPLLFALASHLPGISPDTGLVALHICFGALLLVTAPLLLQRTTSPLVSVIATGLGIYSVKQVAWGIMSEWLGMSMVTVTSLLYLAWLSRPSPRLALTTSVCASLAVLTRAALLLWIALLPFMVLQAQRGGRRVTAAAVVTGLLPLFVWGSFNHHRTGTFSIVPYEGLNLLATARTLGPIPLESSDSEEQLSLIRVLNEHGVTVADSALEPDSVHRWEGEFYGAFHTNFNITTEAIRSLRDSSGLRPSLLAARGLREHAERYRRFLRGGARSLVNEYLPLILACIVAAMWLARRAPGTSRWALGVGTVCVVSLGYLTVIFGTMLWLHRYFVPIQPILLICMTISTVRLLVTFSPRS
jgi:ABC-type multidrug transport system fused ATPase/permease subunit